MSSSLRRTFVHQVYETHSTWPRCPGGSRGISDDRRRREDYFTFRHRGKERIDACTSLSSANRYVYALTRKGQERGKAWQLNASEHRPEVFCFVLRRTNQKGRGVELARVCAPVFRVADRTTVMAYSRAVETFSNLIRSVKHVTSSDARSSPWFFSVLLALLLLLESPI
ncbi:hypothetical protein VNO77_44206 [Canavalia gladiata]|uniref:Uncharacterized protein n=1 Tax=Canavalia gladiata TaxID=3824 RepID=A0AAN9JZ89_CANGL